MVPRRDVGAVRHLRVRPWCVCRTSASARGCGWLRRARERSGRRLDGSPEAASSARLAPVVAAGLGVAPLAQYDHRLAPGAPGRLVGRRVLELLEVVLVRPVVDVDLGLEISPAPAALLPGAAVSLRVVVAAQREAPMVAVTAVPRVRE